MPAFGFLSVPAEDGAAAPLIALADVPGLQLKDHLPRSGDIDGVFQPFARLDPGDVEPAAGVGRGLNIDIFVSVSTTLIDVIGVMIRDVRTALIEVLRLDARWTRGRDEPEMAVVAEGPRGFAFILRHHPGTPDAEHARVLGDRQGVRIVRRAPPRWCGCRSQLRPGRPCR